MTIRFLLFFFISFAIQQSAMAQEPGDWASKGQAVASNGYVLQGQQFFKEGQYEQARESFLNAIETDPAHEGAWEMLGRSQYLLGEFDAAVTAFNRALSNSERADLFFYRGLSYKKLQQPEAAIADLEQATILDQQQATYFAFYGDMLRENGKYHRALEAYQRALQLKPRYEKAKQGIKSAQAFLGMDEEVALEVPRTVKMVSAPPTQIDYKTIDQEQARKEWTSPNSATGKHWSSVAEGCKQHLAADPSNPDAMWCIGQSYYYLGKFDQAIPYLEGMRNTELAGAAYFNLLAECYEQTKQYSEAILAYEKALEIFPGSSKSRNGIQQCWAALTPR